MILSFVSRMNDIVLLLISMINFYLFVLRARLLGSHMFPLDLVIIILGLIAFVPAARAAPPLHSGNVFVAFLGTYALLIQHGPLITTPSSLPAASHLAKLLNIHAYSPNMDANANAPSLAVPPPTDIPAYHNLTFFILTLPLTPQAQVWRQFLPRVHLSLPRTLLEGVCPNTALLPRLSNERTVLIVKLKALHNRKCGTLLM